MISTLLPKKMTARVDNAEFTTIFPIFPMARGQARSTGKKRERPRREGRNAHRIFAADVVNSSKSDGKVTKVVEFSRSISHTPSPTCS